MDTTLLEQVLASAVRYIQNHSGIETAPYFDEEPEQFIVPSLFFPVPLTRSKKVTLASYRSTLTVNCQFMARTSWEAYQTAINVRDCLLIDNGNIPIMNKDGSVSGSTVKVFDTDVRELERGNVQLSFDLNHYFTPQKAPGSKIQKVNIGGLVKPDALYEAWFKATEELRKQQEVEKECLQKALNSL